MSNEDAKRMVVLCDCGPIIKDLVDLDEIERRALEIPGVEAVVRHSTLCSTEGKAWLAEQLRANPGLQPVIAACSPREHVGTFNEVCDEAGINPYLISRANLREQCAWVTPDKAEATAKALSLIAASAARVEHQAPLTPPEIECETSVLIVGSGVAGMTAALLIADSGRDVVVVERQPAVGGLVPLLGETFPDMECAPCMIEPLMDKLLHHDRIEVLTSSEVAEVVGYLGNFNVSIERRPRHVALEACFACQTCSGVCPVEVADPYGAGIAMTKAIGIPYTGALPNASALDERSCLRFNGGECSACADACPFGAIDLDEQGSIVERHVGAVILATGTELKTADVEGSCWESPGVMTTWQLERLINPDGPTGGELARPDTEAPHSIAFVHCADELGCAPASECSRTCCMAIAKHITETRHKLPDATITEFTWDRVLGGPYFKSVEASGDRASSEVRLGSGDRLRVEADGSGGKVVWTASGLEVSADFDLVVIAAPHAPSAEAKRTAMDLGVDVDGRGFVLPVHRRLSPFSTRVDGVFVAGSAQEQRDIRESVSHSAAAAAAVLSALVPGKTLVREAATAVVDPDVCGGCQVCVLSCPYHAIAFDTEKRAAEVNELLCRGCGTCAAACPSAAIMAKHFTDEQLLAEIRTLADVTTHDSTSDPEGAMST